MSLRGVGDGACGLLSPNQIFNGVRLMYIACYKGLLICHSIPGGFAEKTPVRSRTLCDVTRLSSHFTFLHLPYTVTATLDNNTAHDSQCRLMLAHRA